ncbi:MAG TPA: sigma-70 family RNA polymerase sigma factor [Planctomycetota bacterium]|nr:sigma-70 family RNA polymerase sigma factor [Planctomycetota bacterium]
MSPTPPALERTTDELSLLLKRYVESGDETSMEDLVGRTRPKLLTTARRIGAPQDAEDAVQTAYLSLVRARERPLDAPIFPWLLTAVVRTAYRRKAICGREDALARRLAQPREIPAPDSEAIAAEESARVLNNVARLPALYRDPVVLCELEGLTTSETARLLGVADATVRTRLHRARILLRKRWSPRLLYAFLVGPWLLADRAQAAAGTAKAVVGTITAGAAMKTKSVLVGAAVVAGGAIAVSLIASPPKPRESPAQAVPVRTAQTPPSPTRVAAADVAPLRQPVESPPAPPKAKASAESPAVEPARPTFDPARLNSEEFFANLGFQVAMLEEIVRRFRFNWEEERPADTGSGSTERAESTRRVFQGELRARIGPDGESIPIRFHTPGMGRAGPIGFRMSVGDRRSDEKARKASRLEGLRNSLRSWDDALGVAYDFRAADDETGSRRLEAIVAQTTGWLDSELVPHLPFARDSFHERQWVLVRPGDEELGRKWAGQRRLDIDRALWNRLVRVFETFTAGIPR